MYSPLINTTKKFLYDYLKAANEKVAAKPEIVDRLRAEFERMLGFVAQTFPHGFRKNSRDKAVPRVRFEAIAVGSALALRVAPNLRIDSEEVERRMQTASFNKVVVSDGANVRSKLEGRIDLVKSILLEK